MSVSRHLLTIILIVLMILQCSCSRIKNKVEKVFDKTGEKVINILSTPSISAFNLFTKFPELKENKYRVNIEEGILCQYIPFFYKYYFMYHGDANNVLEYISHIKDSSSEIDQDTICRRIDYYGFYTEKMGLTDYEREKADFFYNFVETHKSDLEIYECVKTPEHHYIIVDKENEMIYHMIEFFYN